MYRPLVVALGLLLLAGAPAIGNDDVLCVQKALNARGYEAGPSDGALGKRTAAAAASVAQGYQLRLPDLSEETAAAWCEAVTALPVAQGKPVAGGVRPKGIAPGLPTLIRQRWNNAKPWGMLLVPDPVDPDNEVLRVELRYGDCGKDWYSAFDDCRNGNERVELTTDDTRFSEGSVYRFDWRLYFPESFRTVSRSADIVVGQFHYWDPAPTCCAIMFSYNGRGIDVRRLVDPASGARGVIENLIPEAELRGRWHEIGIDVRWSNSQAGYFRIAVNGEPRYSYDGPTLSDNDAYLKIGLYRLDTGPNEPPAIVFLDDIRATRR